MGIQALLCVWVSMLAAPETPKVLLVLATGTDVWCEIVREEGGDIFVLRGAAQLRIDARQVVKRVSAAGLAAEIEERQQKVNDAAGCLRLALLCLEIGRSNEAVPFVEKAQSYLKGAPKAAKTNGKAQAAKAKSSAKETSPSEGAAAAKDAAAPWPPADGALFLIDVKKRVESEVVDDSVRKVRVQGLFADSPFGLGADTAADYIIRIGLEAVKVKTNDFYGSVAVSHDWEGRVNCVIRHVKTGKEVLRLNSIVVRETLPVVAKGDEVLTKAFEQFMRSFRNQPALRFAKGDESAHVPSLRTLPRTGRVARS